jgi:hypothetical protein
LCPKTFYVYLSVLSRVARWFVFKPKIPIWVNFGGSWNGKSWYIYMTIWRILLPLEIFNVHLVYLSSFGIFSPVLVFCSKKNLATLVFKHSPLTYLVPIYHIATYLHILIYLCRYFDFMHIKCSNRAN